MQIHKKIVKTQHFCWKTRFTWKLCQYKKIREITAGHLSFGLGQSPQPFRMFDWCVRGEINLKNEGKFGVVIPMTRFQPLIYILTEGRLSLLYYCTPARTLFISGLKSWVLKLPFLLKNFILKFTKPLQSCCCSVQKISAQNGRISLVA